MDQNPPPNPDGHDIVHEVDDLPGFDQRQVGGTVTWIHNVSTALGGQSIATATLRVAVVGLIDQNFPGIDNYLFVNGVEVLGAFDNSHDGWRLYEFPLNPAAITNGILVVELRASAPEGWGGPDYSELVVTTAPPVGPHLLLGSDFTLRFQASVTNRYQLERSATLTNWADFGPPIRGFGGVFSTNVSTTGASMDFFRLRVTTNQ